MPEEVDLELLGVAVQFLLGLAQARLAPVVEAVLVDAAAVLARAHYVRVAVAVELLVEESVLVEELVDLGVVRIDGCGPEF